MKLTNQHLNLTNQYFIQVAEGGGDTGYILKVSYYESNHGDKAMLHFIGADAIGADPKISIIWQETEKGENPEYIRIGKLLGRNKGGV